MKGLMKGNEALGEAAIRAGCVHFFGYPITPQTEVPEYLVKRLPEVGGVFVQAESEVAAINMVFGAAGVGVKCMTSSSSPGISLMAEGLSYIAACELPCVIINIMRAGPGLGGILPSQSDYLQATKRARPRRLPADRAGAVDRAGSGRSDDPGVRAGGEVPQPGHGLRRRHDRPDDGAGGVPGPRAAASRSRRTTGR